MFDDNLSTDHLNNAPRTFSWFYNQPPTNMYTDDETHKTKVQTYKFHSLFTNMGTNSGSDLHQDELQAKPTFFIELAGWHLQKVERNESAKKRAKRVRQIRAKRAAKKTSETSPPKSSEARSRAKRAAKKTSGASPPKSSEASRQKDIRQTQHDKHISLKHSIFIHTWIFLFVVTIPSRIIVNNVFESRLYQTFFSEAFV